MICSLVLQFKPEFLNRIDEYVVFNSLNKDNLRGIVKNEVKRLEGRLKDRDITMEISDEALGFIADIGFDPVYGARPLKRAIQRSLESVVAQGILRSEYDDGDTIVVTVKDERLDVRKSSGTTEKAIPALNESVLE
jgi:ATP-dependent Clp protease ATP-binding subunit ClpB